MPNRPDPRARRLRAGMAFVVIAAILASAAMQPGMRTDEGGDPTAGLAPTRAGLEETAPAQDVLQPDNSGAPGSQVRGRVKQVYVRLHDHVFLAVQNAPAFLQDPDKLYVDIETPGPLRSGATLVRARLMAELKDVRPGDIVAARIAHRYNRLYFPVRETTTVTARVASADSALARAYTREVLAGPWAAAPAAANASGASPWLLAAKP